MVGDCSKEWGGYMLVCEYSSPGNINIPDSLTTNVKDPTTCKAAA